ncbi:MAG: hypothetical protein MAG431_01187 [Chloroflexi bacterium]|nr:hypothetical protein [Chloroflexota bacterium]
MKQFKRSIRNYFVDESGDGVLFNRKGRIIVGERGCSKFFILGFVDIPNLADITSELNALRVQLLADPYFLDVPSMQPETHKTAEAFHAKDDLPEVRKEVFTLLRQHQIHFSAVVRDKQQLLSYVKQRNKHDDSYRYHPNELYDYLVRRLFKTRLHKDDEYNIYFAKRGKSDRTTALLQALQTARHRFCKQHNIENQSLINVIPTTPKHCVGQQVVDYFLWALQRFYERGETRFIHLLWDSVSVVHDLDDTRQAAYGVYYTSKKPLTVAALENRRGI